MLQPTCLLRVQVKGQGCVLGFDTSCVVGWTCDIVSLPFQLHRSHMKPEMAILVSCISCEGLLNLCMSHAWHSAWQTEVLNSWIRASSWHLTAAPCSGHSSLTRALC